VEKKLGEFLENFAFGARNLGSFSGKERGHYCSNYIYMTVFSRNAENLYGQGLKM
jgi:hypothetical protein